MKIWTLTSEKGERSINYLSPKLKVLSDFLFKVEYKINKRGWPVGSQCKRICLDNHAYITVGGVACQGTCQYFDKSTHEQQRHYVFCMWAGWAKQSISYQVDKENK